MRAKVLLQWVRERRGKLFNPISKGVLVATLLFPAVLPCINGLLTPIVAVFVLLSAIAFLFFSHNDHKIWKVSIFVSFLLTATIIAFTTYTSCAPDRRIISGIPLRDVQNFTSDKDYHKTFHFRLQDGQAVTQYSAVLDLAGGRESVMVAPLVPSLSNWNVSMTVTAWAFADITSWIDGPEIKKQWSDPSLHEGILTFDPDLQSAPSLLESQFHLKGADDAPILRWGRPGSSLLSILLIVASVLLSLVFILVLVGWAMDYYYLFRWTNLLKDANFVPLLNQDEISPFDDDAVEQVYEMQDRPAFVLEDEEEEATHHEERTIEEEEGN